MTGRPNIMRGRSGNSHKGVLLLPRTSAGRALLRAVLPAARSPDRTDGELPDGSSIYGQDFDALAEEVARDYAEYERWCQDQGHGDAK